MPDFFGIDFSTMKFPVFSLCRFQKTAGPFWTTLYSAYQVDPPTGMARTEKEKLRKRAFVAACIGGPSACDLPDKASYLPKGAQLLAEIKFRNPLKRAKSLKIGELEEWLTANPRAATDQPANYHSFVAPDADETAPPDAADEGGSSGGEGGADADNGQGEAEPAVSGRRPNITCELWLRLFHAIVHDKNKMAFELRDRPLARAEKDSKVLRVESDAWTKIAETFNDPEFKPSNFFLTADNAAISGKIDRAKLYILKPANNIYAALPIDGAWCEARFKQFRPLYTLILANFTKKSGQGNDYVPGNGMVEMDDDGDGGDGASPAGGSTNEFCDVSQTKSSDFWDYIPGGQLHVYYIHYIMTHHELSECTTSANFQSEIVFMK